MYHLANPTDASKLRTGDNYRAPSLDSEGFIHCCTGTQLPGVIQRYYIDAVNLVLLHINADLLTHQPVYENTVGGTELFPHVYGEINATAVQNAITVDQSMLARVAASEHYQP
ncbi:MAG: DUF952 domain-containing protein [Gammaproteobacteria bacterium]|nr:DUF952 domain-containing protein [Gammaproteobacteria bacterium]